LSAAVFPYPTLFRSINVSDDRRAELEKISANLSAHFLVNSVDHLLKVIGEMKSSGQPRIVLELAVLKLALEPTVDLQNILDRLEDRKSTRLNSSHVK